MGYDGSIRINTEISTKSVQVQLAALENRMVKTTDKITSLRAKMDSLKDAKIPTQEYQNLQKELDKSTQELEKMVAQDSKLADIDSKIKRLSQSSAEYAAKMKEVAAQKIPAYEYSEMQKELAKAEKNADSLYGKLRVMEQTGDTASKGYERLKQQIKNADQLVSELRNGMLELEQSGKAFTLGTDTEQYRNLSSKYEQVNAELEKQKGIHSEIAQKRADAVQKTIELKSQMSQLVEEGRAFTLGSETEEYAKLGQQLKYAENDIAVLNKRHDDLIAKQRKTSDGYKKLGDVAKKAFTTVGNMLKKANSFVVSFVKRIKEVAQKHLPFFRKETEKTKSSLSGFGAKLKNLALSLLIFNQISKIIKGATSGIKEGFENLFNENEKFKNSIESVKASLLTLKNALAGAFTPIVEIAIPYIQKLIGWLTEAVNLIGQFIAALTGRKTYTKAIKQSAAASKDAAEATEDETDAMNKQLSPLDKLNNLTSQENKKKADGGSADSGSGMMFEEVPIDSNILEMADKVKDILSKLFAPLKEAWNREGKFVMDSWKYALDEVWKLIKDIGRDFLTVWQQEATVRIFEDLLHIIGDIGLIIGHLARNFREAWNESEVGLHILENIRDIIGIIVKHIRNATDATVEWADKLDFYPLLDSFNRFLESLGPVVDALAGVLEDFYIKVMLPLGKWVLEKGLPELLQVFIDFNNKVDWETLRANLAEFWEHLEPFAETVGEGLIIFIERVSDALADFLNSQEFKDFLVAIENWMDSVSPEDVADALELIAKGLISLKLALLGYGAIKGISAVLTTIATFLSLFGAGGAGSAIGGVLSGITSGLGSFLGALNPVTIAVGALVAGLGYVFATNEEVRESFQNAVNIIRGGLQPAFEFVTNTLLPDLNAGWERLLEILIPLGEFLKEIFTSIWQDMINPALTYIGETVLPKLIESFENLWNNVLVPFGQFLASVLEPVIQIISDILKILWENVVVPLADAIGNVLSKAFEGLCDIFNNVVIPILNSVIEVFQFLWDNVLSSIVDFLWDTFQPAFENVFQTVGGIIDDLSRIFRDLIDFVVGVLTGDWKKAWESAVDIVKTIAGRISDLIGGIITKIGNLASKLKGAFSGTNGTFSSATSRAVQRMSSPTAYHPAIAALQNVEIPAYATGQVIPRTMRQHLAILGDNNRETEVVSPLSTMKQAFREEVASLGLMGGGNGQEINLHLTVECEGRQLLQIMQKLDSEYFKQHGKHAFA